MSRLIQLVAQQFDVAVIGAGATGCGVARDAALRGLSVLLLDRGDIAAGASSGSARMIHGGLRYLMRGQWALVRECLRERNILRRLAPHLVRTAPFYLALYRPLWRERWSFRLGLAIADRLVSVADGSDLRGAHDLSPEAMVERVPGLAR